MRKLWVVVARVCCTGTEREGNWKVVDSTENEEGIDTLYKKFIAANPTYDAALLLLTSYESKHLISKNPSCYRDKGTLNAYSSLYSEAVSNLYHRWLHPTPF